MLMIKKTPIQVTCLEKKLLIKKPRRKRLRMYRKMTKKRRIFSMKTLKMIRICLAMMMIIKWRMMNQIYLAKMMLKL